MKKLRTYPIAAALVGLVLLLAGCSTTKYVPDGQYLLDKAKVSVEGTKEVTSAQLANYLRQKPNSEILGFWKLQLQVYNSAPKDTTTKTRKWLANNAHKMGEAPEIYDPYLTRISQQQIEQTMYNNGFFEADVDTVVSRSDKKLRLEYQVHAGPMYTIGDYQTNIENEQVERIARQTSALVHRGDRYDVTTLDEERQRVTSAMRNRGYYYFDKSLIEYEADSSMSRHTVDVTMTMTPFLTTIPDSIRGKIYTCYSIREVYFHSDVALREKVLRRKCTIRRGEVFSERRLDRAYANLNGLGPVKYVDIRFVPVDSCHLDCHVMLSRTKLNAISAEIEGTFSAGDWGVAAGVGYTNKNLFHGAEQLQVNARGSYEWRANGGRAIEGKVEAGLQFPSQVKVNVAYNYQQRPEEYTRTIASAGLYYVIPRRPRVRWSHRFNLLDISYIYLPWMSEQFKTDFIDKASVLKSSYEDHFIVGWSYAGQYSNFSERHRDRSYLNFNYSIETAGNLLYGLSAAAHAPKDEITQAYRLGQIPFAQYAKADVNFTYNQMLAPTHRLVYHAGLGLAVPYLNAQTIPFEKRYFSGGANSVRGWQARTLGPGTFRGNGSTRVYDLQAGDIRLDLNLEYRWKVWRYLELAAFADAGNIWTIRDYSSQPGGAFTRDFYKQIAWSYGAGVRLDLSLFIFRIDLGVKLHDPSRIDYGTQWRVVRPGAAARDGLNWHDDFTFHFAIGYPF